MHDVYLCYDPISSGFIGILPDRPMIIPVEVHSALELVYFKLVLPQKAYDKVKWPFLQQVLWMKGFSMKWCAWINQVITKGSVAIKVNDDVGHYFQTRKGVRQGDPLSPILFNIVVDMLAILIARAKENQQFSGVVPHLVDDGPSVLQYADDTILFLEDNLEQAKNLKLLLCAF